MTEPTEPITSRIRAGRAQRVLGLLIEGAKFDDIVAKERITRKQTEKTLGDEFRRRWVAPTPDFVKLQIARLDGMMAKFVDGVHKGELGAIDRALKIVDRLDRYHGFTRAARAIEPYGEEERERLLQKLNDMAERLQPDLRDE